MTKLKFGGVEMPTPVEFSIGSEKIWSQNAGRTADGTMTGDIRTIKHTFSIAWANLTGEEIALIKGYIDSVSHAFFTMTYLDETFKPNTVWVYAGTPAYKQLGWDEKRQLVQTLNVDLIER